MATFNIWAVTTVLAMLLSTGQVLACGRQAQSSKPTPVATPTPIPAACTNVALLHGTPSDIRNSVLRTLCAKGHQHVQLKTEAIQRTASNPKVQVKRTEQFAVVNIHRDSFSDQVRWEAGGVTDVINTPKWFVDEEIALSNGYNWYRHGLPLWPLLDQALTQKEGIANRNKKLDWPSYGLATPLYLASFEASNSRDLTISVRKVFAGDTARQQQSPITFANSAKFQTSALEYLKEHFQDQAGYTRADIAQIFDDPSRWIQPLVKQSLRPMLESFMKRQKARAPKASDIALCPDEVYLFFHKKPCEAANTCQVVLDVQQQLRLINCVNTDVVVGYAGSARSASHG